jgi:hypothetical protein
MMTLLRGWDGRRRAAKAARATDAAVTPNGPRSFVCRPRPARAMEETVQEMAAIEAVYDSECTIESVWPPVFSVLLAPLTAEDSSLQVHSERCLFPLFCPSHGVSVTLEEKIELISIKKLFSFLFFVFYCPQFISGSLNVVGSTQVFPSLILQLIAI